MCSINARKRNSRGNFNRSHLERAGTPISPNDLIIAATVRAAGATLITANLREFSRIPDLRCEDWTVG